MRQKHVAVPLLVYLYSWLLRLYPAGFRDAFAAEMAFVCEAVPQMDPGFKEHYLHIDGRPAVFVWAFRSMAQCAAH